MNILKKFGKAGSYEINLVKWENSGEAPGLIITSEPCIDIRRWVNGIPKNGVCLYLKALPIIPSLYERFADRVCKDLTDDPYFSGTYIDVEYKIFFSAGIVEFIDNHPIRLTYSSFKGNKPQVDIRPWLKDYSGFTSGVRLDIYNDFIPLCSTLYDICKSEGLLVPMDFQKGSEEAILYGILADLDLAYLMGLYNNPKECFYELKDFLISKIGD